MLREAKTSYKETIWTKLLWARKLPNSREFWGIINNLTKGSKLQQEAGIGEKTWIQHLQNRYSSTEFKLCAKTTAASESSQDQRPNVVKNIRLPH